MKTLIKLFLIAFAPLTLMAAAPANPSANTKAVLARYAQFNDAVKRADWENYFNFFDQQNFTGSDTRGGRSWDSFEDFKADSLPGFQTIASTQSFKATPRDLRQIDANTLSLISTIEYQFITRSGSMIRGGSTSKQIWSNKSGSWLIINVTSAE